MSSVIFDPENPTQAFIGNATENMFGIPTGSAVIGNIHHPNRCEGRGCVMHHPSNHHMVSWKLNWRDDRGIMERLCPHGVGHPDPDSAAFQKAIGRDFENIHGCDGCCRP